MNLLPLLAPISDSAPTGVNLRTLATDLTFVNIGQLSTELSPMEDPAGLGKDANWPGVLRECEEALTTRTKDLELANGLTQAWTALHGFQGLARGLELVNELCDRYWDTLHPGWEDGEIILPIRARHISWLGGTEAFLMTVRRSPLFAGDASDPKGASHRSGPSPSWFDREEALRLEDLRVRSPKAWEIALQDGTMTLEAFDATLSTYGPDELLRCFEAVEASRRELTRLDEFSAKHFEPDESPRVIPLQELLESISDFLRERLPAGVLADEATTELAEGEAPAETSRAIPTSLSQISSESIRTRSDALHLLGEIAKYLRRTEPHSPVSYLVQRAVRWGEMPLEQVLKEVVKDPNVLGHIWDTLGITPSED